MENKKDNPGIHIPPPLIYVIVYLAAVFIQKTVPVNDSLFCKPLMKIIGVIFLIIALLFLFRSLRQFFQSKNTVITIQSANSLQTNGIYSITRNPMYLGLALIYLGISCLIGNWWNIILFSFLLLIIQEFIIKREEKYLQREFGQEYLDYKRRVRRWL
jgi:protein-S-isoprenylcysteine O-methyltransferase Ste14